jgi:chaperonin GroES
MLKIEHLKPILHRILVKPDPVEIKTESGIIVQLDKREQKAGVVGTVIDLGTTCFKDYGTTAAELGIEIGTKVYFAKYGGAEFKVDGESYRWLNDEDVLGVVK